MAAPSSGNPWTNLRVFVAAQTPPDVPDRDLLDRFLRLRDEAAFAALVHRHGGMVLAACRRVLHNPHDAEDACQATLLILAHKAAATDKEGRFRLTGIGANRLVSLRLGGPGLAAATIVARTQRGSRLDLNLGNFGGPDPHGCFGAEFTVSAGPARPIVGVVRDADTGRPVPGALVVSHRFAGHSMQGLAILRTRADAQGRYRLDGMPAGKGNALQGRGPLDLPYLPAVAEVDTSAGDGPASPPPGRKSSATSGTARRRASGGCWPAGRATGRCPPTTPAAPSAWRSWPWRRGGRPTSARRGCTACCTAPTSWASGWP